MERKFDERMATCIRDFISDLGIIVREYREYEAELLTQIDCLKGDLARMMAKLQGVRDQVMDLPDTIPNADDIAARGRPHHAINDDIRESMANLEAMEAEIAAMRSAQQGKKDVR